MNRTSVLACIQRHLHAARTESGDLRPLGELIPPIAAELRTVIGTSGIQVSVTPVPLVAAFIDGVISPQEEFAVCQAILVDNSVLAELVAGVLALEEVHLNTASLPPLSNDLAARLFEVTSQVFSASAVEPADAVEHVVTPEYAEEQAPTFITARKPVSTRAILKWLQPAMAVFAVAACLLLIIWWTFNQATTKTGRDEVVRVPSQPEVLDSHEPTLQGELPQSVRQSEQREGGVAVQTPNGNPTLTPPLPSELSLLETPPEMPQVVVAPPCPIAHKA